jgi:hypothetical protein
VHILPANSSQVIGLCVWDFVCRDLTVTSIASAFLPSHTLEIKVEDLAITCGGEWNVTEYGSDSSIGDPSSLLYTGAFSLGMTQLTAATALSFTNYSTYYSLPRALLFSNCSVSSVNYEIHFLGGAVGKTLDATLAPALEAALENHTQDLLCDVLGPGLSSALTDLIMESNVEREGLIGAGREAYPPPVLNGTFDWRASTLARAHSLLDSLSVLAAGEAPGALASCLYNSTGFIPRPGAGSNESDLIINRLFDFLTNNTGEITVPMNTTIPLGCNTTSSISGTLEITAAVLSGLDSFSVLTLLAPAASSGAVLTSSLGLSDLQAQLSATLTLHSTAPPSSPSSAGDEQAAAVAAAGLYSESFTVTLQLTDALLDVDLVVALGDSSLAGLFVDQYLADPGCVLLALQQLAVSSLALQVTVQEVSVQQVSGDASELDSEAVSLLDDALEWLLHSWPVSELVAGIGQTVLKDDINSRLAAQAALWVAQAAESCPEHHEAAAPPAYLAWNTSERLGRANAFFNTALGAEGINQVVNCVTHGTGQLTVLSNRSNSSLTLSGLNSFFEFSLLAPLPQQPYDLGTSLGLGQCAESGSPGCTPLGITWQGSVAQSREVYIEVEMRNVEMFVDLFFQLDTNAVLNLNFLQVQTPGCIMTAAESLLLQACTLYLTDAELILGGSGSTPINITHAVQSLVSRAQSNGGAVSRANVFLAQVTDSAASRCAGTFDPSADDPPPEHHTHTPPARWTWQAAVALVCVFLGATFAYWLCGPHAAPSSALIIAESDSSRKGEPKLIHSHSHSSASRAGAAGRDGSQSQSQSQRLRDKLLDWSDGDDSAEEETTDTNHTKIFATAVLSRLGYSQQACRAYDAMFVSARLPLWLRVLFPLLVVACIATVTASNMLTIASVMVELQVGQVKIRPDSLLDFSLGATVHDM